MNLDNLMTSKLAIDSNDFVYREAIGYFKVRESRSLKLKKPSANVCVSLRLNKKSWIAPNNIKSSFSIPIRTTGII